MAQKRGFHSLELRSYRDKPNKRVQSDVAPRSGIDAIGHVTEVVAHFDGGAIHALNERNAYCDKYDSAVP